MRFFLGACAAIALSSPVSAQAADSAAHTLVPPDRPATRPPRGMPPGMRAATSADTIRLTRRQAIAEALTNNAQLEVAREQTAEARARRVQDVAIPDPGLTGSLDQESRFLGAPGAKNVQLGVSIPFPDKFRLQNRIGVSDIRNFEANLRLQRQTVAFLTSAAYDSLLVARRHQTDRQEAMQLSRDFLRRTQARYEAGTAAKLDVIKAQVDVAQAQNDLITSEREVANAEASLNRQLGRVIGSPIAPADSLDVPPPLPDSATIDGVALANRPELAMIASQQRGAAASTALAREFWLPDVTMSVSRDYTQPGSPLFSTGLAMPFPVFLWQHTKGDIALAAHTEKELAATFRDVRAQVTQDVRSAYANASTSMRQVIFLRDELVPSAREAYRVASTSYTLGGSSALEVLQARRDLLDAQTQLADALANANTARADLERALGVPLPPLGASNR